jgi:hypothetical protein
LILLVQAVVDVVEVVEVAPDGCCKVGRAQTASRPVGRTAVGGMLVCLAAEALHTRHLARWPNGCLSGNLLGTVLYCQLLAGPGSAPEVGRPADVAARSAAEPGS